MRTINEVILNAGDASGNLSSNALNLDQMFGYFIQVVITGDAAGSIKLQGSADPGSPGPVNPGSGAGIVNWNDIDGSTENVTGAGLISWNVENAFYKWVRVVYTSVSGTGTMTIRANSKGA